jgi:heme exporter protein C
MDSSAPQSERTPLLLSLLQLMALVWLALSTWLAWSQRGPSALSEASDGTLMALSAFVLLLLGVLCPLVIGSGAKLTVRFCFSRSGSRGALSSGFFVLCLVLVAGFAALYVAPTERTMGIIQRIFYVHLPSAAAGGVALLTSVTANIAYLATRKPKWDWLGVSAAEVGVVCFTCMLVTGPIWAHPVWGIWWDWDAKLTSTFVLWVMYLVLLLLRTLISDPERRALASAIFGIFAFLDVPLVYMSNRWWRTQHPAPVIAGGPNSGLAPMMSHVLLTCMAAFIGLVIILIRQRYRLESVRHDVEEMKIEAQLKAADREAR